MYDTMQGHWWHDMNEERGDLIKRVEYHAISPHSNGNSIVPVGEAIGADEKSLGAWESPDAKHGEQVDKIA